MKKCEYFCDRCEQRVDSEFCLLALLVNRPGDNPLRANVCDSCAKAICKFIDAPVQPPAEKENPT
jgi:hypothetical protein